MHGKNQPKLPEIVKRNIRALRTEMGLTQQELANRAGFKVAFVSRLESTAQNLTLLVLERLATGLKCPIERLVTNRESLSPPRNQVKKLDDAITLLAEFRERIRD